MTRVVCWWSAGVASTVAAHLTLKAHPDAIVAYCDTASTEHPDNERFLLDCERWFAKPILRLRSEKYRDTWDVYEKTRYLVGPGGARCTTELKKLVRRAFERSDDVQVFGYTADEAKRVRLFRENNPEVTPSFPLVDAGLSHRDCRMILRGAGIQEPTMYGLGYRNNNCIGCVKGQSGYWNKIRVDFPEVFDRMAKLERELDVAINKTERRENGKRVRLRVFLDELPPNAGVYKAEKSIECGVACYAEKKEAA